MKYYSTILSLVFLSFFAVISNLYLGNISNDIEKENIKIDRSINFMKDQISINEIEYSMYNNYHYLKKLYTIYFNDNDLNFSNNRISFYDLKNTRITNLHTASIK